MKTYLGIDYGKSKIGLAKGTDEVHVATPMRIIANDSNFENALAEIVEINAIDEIIVGYPLSLSGEVGLQAREVDEFIKDLEFLGKRVHRQDERFSSRAAVSNQEDDASAAALILQTYLEKL
ncbi:Holliday junction resolvase RuvX [Patescibacteria group bacterium]|nr:Holliday junction resolvase RuvX [Patescibacteria group bacterium]